MRCPSCGGLRSISKRNENSTARCKECRRKNTEPITRDRFHNYWLERFTRQEIEDMARAIWE